MRTMQRLTGDCFVFGGESICRAFPFEYLIALDDEESVIGFAKLDLLQNQLLELVGPSELQMDLRKFAIFLFEEMGEKVLTDVSRGLPVRIELSEIE